MKPTDAFVIKTSWMSEQLKDERIQCKEMQDGKQLR